MDKGVLQFILRFKDETKAAMAGVRAGIRDAATETDRMAVNTAAAQKEAAKFDKTLVNMAKSAAGFAAVFVGGLAIQNIIDTIAKFEQQMSTLTAIIGAAPKEMKELREEAKRLGASTRFSSTEVAEGMTLLGQAGFTASEVLKAIGPTLQLAQAGQLNLARAAEVASATLRGFGLQVEEMPRVLDALAMAANKSNADVTSLGEAMKFAAPTATQMGISLEEALAAISVLSDRGITGGMAGRGFQSFVSRLIANEAPIKKLIGSFNIADEGLESVIKRLKDANLSLAQVVKLFGAENLDIYGNLTAGVDAQTNSLGQLTAAYKAASGEVNRVATIMDDNLNGAILNMQSAWEGLILAISEAGLEELLRDMVNGVSNSLNFLIGLVEQFTDATRNADGSLNELGRAVKAAFEFGALLAGWVALNAVLRLAVIAFTTVTKAATGMWFAVGGPISGIILSVYTIIEGAKLLYENFALVRMVVDPWINIFKGVTEALFGTGAAAKAWADQQKKITADIELATKAADTYREAIDAMAKSRGDDINQIQQQIDKNRELLVQQLQVARQHAINAKAVEEQYRNQIRASGRVVRQDGSVDAGTVSLFDSENDTPFEATLRGAREEAERLQTIVDDLEHSLFRGDVDAAIEGAAAELRRQEYERGVILKGIADAYVEITESLDEQLAAARTQVQVSLLEAKGTEASARAAARVRIEAEVVSDLRKAGVTDEATINEFLASQASTISSIVALNERNKDILKDIATLKLFDGPLKELQELEASLARLRAAGAITASEQTSAILNSSYQNSYTEFLSSLGAGGASASALREAEATNAKLLAQFDRFLMEGTIKVEDEARIRAWLELQMNANLLADKKKQEERARSLDQTIGFGAANDLSASALSRQLAAIEDSRRDQERALNDQYQGFARLGQAYRDRLYQINRNADIREREAVLAANEEKRALQDSLGVGAGFVDPGASALDQELARINAGFAANKMALENALTAEKITRSEHDQWIRQLEEKRQRDLITAQQQHFQMGLQGMSSGLDAMAGVLKDAVGENNAVYKALFIASKAFAIANSIVNIQAAIASAAASGPFPANLAAIGIVVAETASILSTIMSARLALKDGGFVSGAGGPRDDKVPAMLSAGEFVVNAASAAKYKDLLMALNGNGRGPSSGMKFKDGGFVSPVLVPGYKPGGGSGAVTIQNVITVTGGGGGEESNRQLADLIDQKVSQGTRRVIQEEMRAGGSMDHLRRGAR